MQCTSARVCPLVYVVMVLATVGCRAGTGPGDEPSSGPPPGPGGPVGVSVFGEVSSASGRAFKFSGAYLEVRDTSCTSRLPDIQGAGWAEQGKNEVSYQAHLVSPRAVGSTCLRMVVQYFDLPAPIVGAIDMHTVRQDVRLTLTPAGAGPVTDARNGVRLDVIVP